MEFHLKIISRFIVWNNTIPRFKLQLQFRTVETNLFLFQRDVNGDCLVGYFFKEVNGTTLVIDKKTDLKSCVNRYQIYSIVPMTPYVFQKVFT